MIAQILLASLIFTSPTLTGGKGLFRVWDATVMDKGGFGIGLTFAGINQGAEHVNDGKIKTWNDAVIRLPLTYTPFSFMDFSVVPGYILRYPIDSPDSSFHSALWDVEVNARLSKKVGSFGFGILGLGFIPTKGSNDIFGDAEVGYGAKGLVSFKSGPLGLHLNGGYTSHYQTGIEYGAGLEFLFSVFNPFVEVTGAQYDSLKPLLVTPGLRIAFPMGMAFEYGADIGFNNDAKAISPGGSRYIDQVSLGIMYSTPEKKIRYGSIIVKVYDEQDQPILAQVTFPGTDIPAAITSGDGIARIDSLLPGPYSVKVTPTWYVDGEKKADVLIGDVVEVIFTGIKYKDVLVKGKVVDRETKNGIAGATVTFELASIKPITTDKNGEFSVKLYPGEYKVTAAALDYIAQDNTISAKAKTIELTKEIALVKKGMKITFRGINFKTASAEILPESYPILDEAAKVLKENPSIKVEIQGHTDARGSNSYNKKLSDDRAASVKTYLVDKHGISANRLVAKGYGEDEPIAPNDTEEGMAKNRRVVFMILEG